MNILTRRGYPRYGADNSGSTKEGFGESHAVLWFK